ncbi:MAG: ATP-dependent Clp protease ATP-binding subunit [Clostridia bacterium]|nr:ATP-dependent Clp protease ATP-binding subunit [Clostridia bacterium]
MNIPICSRCKKRPATVFVTRNENGNTIKDGLCLICANEVGLRPFDNMLKQMGMSDEVIESMTGELEEAMADLTDNLPDNPDEHGAPSIDFRKLFQEMGFTGEPSGSGGKKSSDAKKSKKGEEKENRKFLSTYATSLSDKAKEGKIDRIVGRDRELDRLIQILLRRQKNNPCLIGEPGVGKTAIAEALAQRIAEGGVPERLADKEVWLLDLTALVAGTQFRGQFEQRILGLIKEVKSSGNIILVIDEVHNIVGAGNSEGAMGAANMLKPALSRGEIQVIGATTLNEYRKHIEKDSALERRFQPVMVNEPSVDETVKVISGIKSYYENFHQVKISDEIARLSAVMSERYISDRFLPDKAIDLIDEACARVALNTPEINERKRTVKELASLTAENEALMSELEKSEAQTEENYKRLADIKASILRLEERNKELDEIIAGVHLKQADLAEVIEIWTGIPASDIKEGELSLLTGLYERISARVIGQDEAVKAVCRAVKRKRAGISYRKNPVSMIFAGPTGVGKTELVKVLADELFKQPEAMIRLDMSEFMEKHAVSRIIGAPPGYVGYDEAGQLTEKIRRRPYSVVLFDEIEKAHPDVLNILLQILDDGIITDATGRQVNFENTIIIMTTNAGSETNSNVSGFAKTVNTVAKEKTERALFSFLRPEFINRIDEIITFSHLNLDSFSKIADIMLGKLRVAMADKDIKLSYDEAVLMHIANKSYSEKFGARNMRRFIEKEVEDKIAEAIISAYPTKLLGVHLEVSEDKIVIKTL